MECKKDRLQLLYNHFNDVPFSNCYKFYKICIILANCKNITILEKGKFIQFENNTFEVFDFVMYIYYKSITKSYNANKKYDFLCDKLQILQLL